MSRADTGWRSLARRPPRAAPLVALGVTVLWGVAAPERAWGDRGALGAPLGQAPRTYEATALPDAGPEADARYVLRVRPGATLWDIATEALPEVVLEAGNAQALEAVEAAFREAFPGRALNDVRLGDELVLVVPAGTFVTAAVSAGDRGRTIEYESFRGDRLLEFRGDPAVVFRHALGGDSTRTRVLLRGVTSVPPVEIARRVYETEAPDFLQVRRVRAALAEGPLLLEVDLQEPHLDLFRAVRERAVSVEPGMDGLRIYRFDADDATMPFLAVEDAIGDEWDAGNFPRVARREYFRDGFVKRYVVTQPGDALSALSKADNKHWATLAPAWSTWADGQVERIPPFAPAVNELGSLLPGRLLVLVHQPRPEGSRGAECLGIPLGLAATAGMASRWWRRRVPPVGPSRPKERRNGERRGSVGG